MGLIGACRVIAQHGEGGAHYVAGRLSDFCRKHPTKAIELHAIGHSAGSIFHAHFLSTAQKLGVPSFKSTHFLAPAIRVDLFKKLLFGSIGNGKGIDHLTLFTMRRDLEREDNCALVYRKSLLYLIYYALEPERKAVAREALLRMVSADGLSVDLRDIVERTLA